jgi:ABC-type transporter Mla subunit MlaD
VWLGVRVDVYVEMKDPTTVIPRNALIEANQSGLIAESLIDITPQIPIPEWKVLPQIFASIADSLLATSLTTYLTSAGAERSIDAHP